MTTALAINWTNRSVRGFAQGGDPILKITAAARALVLKARESGWDGPPFNPLYIAKMLNVQIAPNSNIADARLLETSDGPKIEFNPQQARERVRFSIAHEVAHLLFPDWHEQIRNRAQTSNINDDWQLEMLCNLVASELVLPIGSLASASDVPAIEELMVERRKYDVSAEAFLIRVVKVSTKPVAMFVASPILSSSGNRSYRIDYYISSPTASRVRPSFLMVPETSVIQRCTAIGHTDSAIEDWITSFPTSVECVGVPGYPRAVYPRVIALVRFDQASQLLPPIKITHGNILEPRGGGPKLLCQLVNDRATKWGGGVARQMATRFPDAEKAFTQAFLEIPREQRLGSVLFTRATDDIMIASMIAQQGFGRSLFPRIRYAALSECLVELTSRALEIRESVHMPRIGTGASGGDWPTIEEMVDDTLVRAGILVTIYDLPPKRPQLELF